jgi:hypothetical protein
MNRTALVCLVLVLGLVATLFSGLFRQDFSTSDRTDFRYGLPFGWHGEQGPKGPVYLTSPPLASWYSWENFTYDAVAWFFLFGIMVLGLRKRK